MARLNRAEIDDALPQVRRALDGLVYGEVVIEVRGGHIQHVRRLEERFMVQNGRVLGE